jgi:CRP-like cAMP-binding protein
MKGIVGRTVLAKDGTRQITAVYVRGDIPDLHSVLQPETASSLRALTECEILRIPHASLRERAANFPGLMEAFWRYTVWDASVASQWVANVGARPGAQRMAHLFCEFGFRMGEPTEEGYTFELPLTQIVLAEACGLSTVHANRTIGALRKADLLHVDRATVTVPSWRKLTEAADFNDAYLQPPQPLRWH